MNKLNANSPAGTQMVSVRLPEPVLKRLDKLADQMSSSRTDVVRRALAVYFRLGDAILVPVSANTRAALNRIAESEDRSAEVVSEEMFEGAVKQKVSSLKPVILRLNSHIMMEFDSGYQVVQAFQIADKPRKHGQ